MTEVEKEAWNSFKNVVSKFPGNNQGPEYCSRVFKHTDEIQIFRGAW